MNVSVGRGVVQAHGGSRRVCGSCLMFHRQPCVWDIKKRHAICGMPLFLYRLAMFIRLPAGRMFRLNLRADCLPNRWSAPEPCCCSVLPVSIRGSSSEAGSSCRA